MDKRGFFTRDRGPTSDCRRFGSSSRTAPGKTK